jgi:hypothetical protein
VKNRWLLRFVSSERRIRAAVVQWAKKAVASISYQVGVAAASAIHGDRCARMTKRASGVVVRSTHEASRVRMQRDRLTFTDYESGWSATRCDRSDGLCVTMHIQPSVEREA